MLYVWKATIRLLDYIVLMLSSHPNKSMSLTKLLLQTNFNLWIILHHNSSLQVQKSFENSNFDPPQTNMRGVTSRWFDAHWDMKTTGASDIACVKHIFCHPGCSPTSTGTWRYQQSFSSSVCQCIREIQHCCLFYICSFFSTRVYVQMKKKTPFHTELVIWSFARDVR